MYKTSSGRGFRVKGKLSEDEAVCKLRLKIRSPDGKHSFICDRSKGFT